MRLLGLAIASFFLGAPLQALEKAPPAFPYKDGQAVPVDITAVDIDYVFDVSASAANARAVVHFKADQTGFPIIDLGPNPTLVELNGDALDKSLFAETRDPSNVTTLRVLKAEVATGSENTLVVTYRLSNSDVDFSTNWVRGGFFMDDLTATSRGFFERYGPANYEFDQVRYRFHVRVVGTSKEHEIFTNGELQSNGFNEWDVVFPAYFTTSSLYFHIMEKDRFQSRSYIHAGIERSFPVTVYASSAYLVDQAVRSSQAIFSELEATYGAFAHARAVIFVTPDGGGMEHCGATMTSLSALGHELTHSWFARGVMPSEGNSGWIDEAVASWRDDRYPSRGAPNRSPVNLGGFSVYKRNTTMAAYDSGARLISEFDGMFASLGGMKAALRRLFQERQRTTIDVPYFQRFLENFSGQNLTAIFNRYVYGRSLEGGFQIVAPERLATQTSDSNHHPRPYTAAEIARYR